MNKITNNHDINKINKVNTHTCDRPLMDNVSLNSYKFTIYYLNMDLCIATSKMK